MPDSPHQDHLAAFKAWAMADENPNALWSIDRCVARELFEQLEAAQKDRNRLRAFGRRHPASRVGRLDIV